MGKFARMKIERAFRKKLGSCSIAVDGGGKKESGTFFLMSCRYSRSLQINRMKQMENGKWRLE